ncbi:MAG TPA: hypothetical protein VN678_11470 [Acidobacteriaceae bacterium]|nr:hypothetical protein [Acidobacteriaceae bacterium]
MKPFEENTAEFEQDPFEGELLRAMRRVDAPEGFADRVLARIAESPVQQWKPSMETVSEFEQELGQAMRHVDAPEGFADRVLRQIAAEERPRAKVLMMPRRVQLWAGGAIAAALLVGAFGVREQRERRQQEQAVAEARQQFRQAMQITGNTLADTRAQISGDTPADARAQQQFEVAMQITNETLASVRAQLQRSGVQLGD